MKTVIIFELFQRNKAMLGWELMSSTALSVSHVGASSHTTRKFVCGAETFYGDFGTMPFNSKNCLLFRKIFTDKEGYDADKQADQ